MTLLEQFKDKVLNTVGSFKLKDEDKREPRYYSFTKCTNGNAIYIYGTYRFNNDFSDPNIKYELVAILNKSSQIIYIIDEYLFNKSFRKEFNYPEGCVSFNDYINETNKYINDVLFKSFYDKIKVDINSITDDDIINDRKQEARNIILCGSEVTYPNFTKSFNKTDIARMICGYINMNDEVNKRFEECKNMYTNIKLGKELVKKFIEEKSVIEDWEIKLANSINNIEANYVTVEFNFNGNIGIGKIKPNTIIRTLIDNDYFSGYDFSTANGGEKLLKELGAKNNYYNKETWLTCKHITKITYSRKTLYENNN